MIRIRLEYRVVYRVQGYGDTLFTTEATTDRDQAAADLLDIQGHEGVYDAKLIENGVAE